MADLYEREKIEQMLQKGVCVSCFLLRLFVFEDAFLLNSKKGLCLLHASGRLLLPQQRPHLSGQSHIPLHACKIKKEEQTFLLL